ncbi:MAG: DDE-type integrase/transposase/recombinase [Lachnospiraceae bacterium]|nr:DDE-type integrase/transposase/recombinase [Lachnospiraceae bacterium]
MNTITHSQRYLPHDSSTRFHAVKLYRTGVGLSFVTRRYHISKSSLLRWNKKFDGSKDSLLDKSHRPITQHPNAHTEEELQWIKNYHRRNPHISVCELYGKLRSERGYLRHPGSLYRVYCRLGYTSKAPSTKKIRKPKPYDTPTELGVKWQLDVKYVPNACYSGTVTQKFYQYTVIDEASRERFLYPYMEQSSYSTCDFLKRAIIYFGYKPKILQTDNGAEFTHIRKTNRTHPLDVLCAELEINHKRIRPRTPQHNGKVERSHRNDQERFYNHMKFYSYQDLMIQMKRYMNRSNRIPMQVLGWQSSLQKRSSIEFQYK